MRAMRYLKRLFGEFFGFAWQNKAWWVYPMMIAFVLLGLAITTTESVAPFIYALF
jgi:hypothetical protein